MLTLAELAADRADGSLEVLSVAGSCAVHGTWDIGLASVATAAGRLCENSSLASTQKLEETGWLDTKRILTCEGLCTMIQCREGPRCRSLLHYQRQLQLEQAVVACLSEARLVQLDALAGLTGCGLIGS